MLLWSVFALRHILGGCSPKAVACLLCKLIPTAVQFVFLSSCRPDLATRPSHLLGSSVFMNSQCLQVLRKAEKSVAVQHARVCSACILCVCICVWFDLISASLIWFCSDLIWFGLIWIVLIWLLWLYSIRFGLVWFGLVGYYWVWFDLIWCVNWCFWFDVWFDLTWLLDSFDFDLIWFDLDLIWFDLIWIESWTPPWTACTPHVYIGAIPHQTPCC